MKVSPNIAVVTNISPNHLDVHHTMEEYFSCKANILKYQKENDIAILGPDSFLPFVKGSLRKFNESKLPFDKEEIKLAGEHNYQNMLAAYNAVKDFVSKKAVLKTARTFSGVEHRLEFVKEVAGVSFYNDSIATTPTRTMAGLKSFPKKVILIAGGYDKLIPFNPMKEVLNEKVKALILIGNTAKKIGSLYDGKDIFYMDSLENAVKKADVTAIAEADVEFHDVIYRGTNNPKLENILNNLREQMYRYRLEYIKDKRVYEILVEELISVFAERSSTYFA